MSYEQNALYLNDERISTLVRTAEELQGLDTAPGYGGPDSVGHLVYLLGTGHTLPVSRDTVAGFGEEPPYLAALVFALWPEVATCSYCEEWSGRPAVQLPIPKRNLLAPTKADIVAIPLCDKCAAFLDATYPNGEFLVYPTVPEVSSL